MGSGKTAVNKCIGNSRGRRACHQLQFAHIFAMTAIVPAERYKYWLLYLSSSLVFQSAEFPG